MDIQPASTLLPQVNADPFAPEAAPAPSEAASARSEAAPAPEEDDSGPVPAAAFAAYGANGRPVTARSSASGTISLLA